MTKKDKLNITVKVNRGNDEQIASTLARFILDCHNKRELKGEN